MSNVFFSKIFFKYCLFFPRKISISIDKHAKNVFGCFQNLLVGTFLSDELTAIKWIAVVIVHPKVGSWSREKFL